MIEAEAPVPSGKKGKKAEAEAAAEEEEIIEVASKKPAKKAAGSRWGDVRLGSDIQNFFPI